MTSLTDVTQAYLASSFADQAIKPPVRLASLVNIIPIGIGQTIDGVVTQLGDRILLAGQTDARQNGIRVVSDGIWPVPGDFSNLVTGTQFTATAGVANSGQYTVTTANPVIIGASSITFVASPFGGLSAETTARIAADNTLQSNINAEASTRSSAITTEASTRATNDTTLQTNITAEATTRAAADTTISTNLAASSGASLVGFLQAGVSAVARTLQSKGRDTLSIKDFGAVGDGVTDDTTAIQAAITFAKTFSGTQTEVLLYWPGGAYVVSTLDYTNAKRIVNIAGGAVIINGKTVGGTAVVNAFQGVAGAQSGLNFKGNFSIQLLGGASYQYGLRLDGCNNSYGFEMTASGTYSVATIALSNSFDSSFFFTPSNTGATSVFLCETAGNVNRCDISLRAAGDGNLANASIGANLIGFGSRMFADIANTQNALDISGAFGCSFFIYAEGNRNCVTTGLIGGGIARANTFYGGEFEVGTNGTGFKLGAGSGSEFTTIISPRVKGVSGGNNRTFLDHGTGGANAYMVRVINEDISQVAPQAIDTISTGTDRGMTGGLPSFSESTYTATLTGCTTSPTFTVAFHRDAGLVTLDVSSNVNITGTSNATTKTLTGMPARLIPTTPKRGTCQASDNGGTFAAATFTLDATGTLNLFTTPGDGAWTAAGTATIKPFSISYTLS